MSSRIGHFDVIARWYDRLIRRPVDDPLPLLLAVEPGHLVLDIGGGTGRNSHGLQAIGAQVVVCDASRGMARRARDKGLPAVVANVARLPFASGRADRLLVVDAFHHFVDPSPQIAQREAAGELVRVLNPGGRLLVEEPDIRHASVKLIALMEWLLLMGSRFLTPSVLAGMFRQAGARVLDVTAAGFSALLIFTVDPCEMSYDARLMREDRNPAGQARS